MARPPFPNLEIEAELGHGTHATVLLARRTTDGTLLAVKVVPAAAAHGRARARARREARLLSRLDHPHVVRLHAVAHQHDDLHLLLEYVPGPTLAEVLRAHPLGAADTMALVGQIGAALDDAHRRGVVHRDVKPSNVLLGPSGAKLADFGLATLAPGVPGPPMTVLTRPGAPVGTAPYMAPEAVEGRRDLDRRVDVYSLGIVAYELCTGSPPFPESLGLLAVLHAHLERDPPRPSQLAPGLPEAMDRALLWPLEKDRDRRPPDVATYVQALRHAVVSSWPALPPPDLPALAARVHRPSSAGRLAAPGPAPWPAPGALAPSSSSAPPSALAASGAYALPPAAPGAPGDLPPVTPTLPPLRRYRPRLSIALWCAAGLLAGAAASLLVWALALR